MSQIRKRSSKECPSNRTPSCPRSPSPRAPEQTTTYGARSSVPFAQLSRTPPASWAMSVTRWPQRRSTSGSAAIRSSRICSVRRLRDVHERRERRAAGLGEGVAEQLGVAVEGARRGPGDALGRDLLAGPDRGPDVQHVALLADGLGPDGVPLRALIEHDRRHAPAGQQQRGGLPDRAGAEHHHRRLRPGCRRVHLAHPCSCAQTSWSRSAVQITGRSTPDSSSQTRETSNGRQCSKIGHLP